MTMLCDTGACKTVLTEKPPNMAFTDQKMIVKSASGHVTTQRLTDPLFLAHRDSGRSCKIQCIYDPSCPVNLLGRDALERLKIGIVPGQEGMFAKLMFSDAYSTDLFLQQGSGEPHYYWTLDLPSLEPLQHIADRYLPDTSIRQPYTEYHNTLRFKKTPGPDPPYDQQIQRLGPQKLILQHLYVTTSGNAICSVIQTDRTLQLNRMPHPHVSVAHNATTDWKDLGNVLSRVETDRYEKTEETHKGWLQGHRTGCMRYTLGWPLTTQPASHITDTEALQ